jgi:thiamine-phosphate pyrophosphorylase
MTWVWEVKMTKKNSRFPETDIYCITASRFSLGRSNIEVVRQMLDAGIKVIQYREPDFSMLQKYHECIAIRNLTAHYGACFIINDDVHLAMAVASDGVHVGQDDLPVEKVRDLVGIKMIIGLSTHSPEQADKAVATGVADYIGVGPLFQTFTKKDVISAVGLGFLDYVVAHHKVPFVAIGGIKENNVLDIVRHGAKCVCLVTEIVGAVDIGAKIRAVREQITKTKAARSI